ncbi:MAG TPA: FkbM family methyltransferase [Polaromonas sp.]|uniref:FkbM family methyltransferase n=1 Tax=Polaromonas sp. TaxID=1869339 RepID=UPI002D31B944|nr:FkbM family methyltransferase [Polaromonas sp.]HYW58462.1 FkbM family methyltransferase [Polaromonas sp.]
MKAIPRPLPFVLVSSGHGTMIVNRNDYRMVDDKRGYGVGHQIFESSYFDPQEVQLALDMLSVRRQVHGDGVVAIDGGANSGVHTVEWAKHMHGWGQVIAVEAQERVFYALAGNLAINNCFNASAHYAALGAEEGSITVPKPDYSKPASFGSLELRQSARNEFIGQAIDYSAAGGQPVKMITVDGLGLSRLDFFKLDIEGMELEGLAGALKSIAAYKPIMLIETIKTDAAALKRLLDGHGYKQVQVGINVLAIHLEDPCLTHINFA